MAVGRGSSTGWGVVNALVNREPTTHWLESASLGRLKAALMAVPFSEWRRWIAAPTVAERGFRAVAGIEGIVHGLNRACRGVCRSGGGPVTAEFGEPRLQAGLTQGSEEVERVCKIVQFRRNPGDDFEDGLMAGIQIPPVQDAFVVKDTVAKIADVLPAPVELGLILLRGGSVGKRLA